MSIAKAKAISHTKECLAYALNKQGAEELCRENLSGETPAELYSEFRIIQSLNDRCINSTIRIEISPAIEDGKRLSKDDWQNIISEFMQRMDLANNRQFIAILHTDRPHKHAHILVNRINFNGTAYNDSNISRRAGTVMSQIAIERGMTTAMSVHLAKQQALLPLKERILEAHKAIVRKGLSPPQYQSLMKQKGIEVVFNQSKTTGRITGMSYVIDEAKIKASSVARHLSFNKLFGVHKEPPTQKLNPRQRLIGQNHSHIDSIKYHITRMFSCNEQVHARPERAEDEEQSNEINFDL